MKGAPISDKFDDVYFSVDDGLAETRHVFMQGNGLPDFWQEKPSFTIAETGFGTGLNFLCAWKSFIETAAPSQRLDFISFEKFPLSINEIKDALAPWADELGEYTDKLLKNYPIRIGGFHRIVFDERIALTLIFGDVNEYILQLNACVDCWFLDGFTPAKNPDMWSKTLFENMARLSVPNARFATFTAAGDVKLGLKAVGFDVQKTDGFARKRDMLVGHYKGDAQERVKTQITHAKAPEKIAIIGGGLAGTACAYILKQYGMTPIIYEASGEIACGASGNDIGLFNTRFAALRDTESEFYNSAYAQLIRTAKHIDGVNYKQSGTLHLINNERKKGRFAKMLKNWHWYSYHMRLLSKEEASDVAGISLDYEAIYLPDAGSISPKKLCDFYAQDIEVHLNHKVTDLNSIDADAIILTNGTGVQDLVNSSFAEIGGLPVYPVRGQVSYITQPKVTKKLKTNICYGGYLSVAVNGLHVVGSTFQKWLKHTDILEEDHNLNISSLKESISALENENLEIKKGRAGLRVSSKDHFPIVGKICDMDNVYISTAFGSHGIVGSIASAHLLADYLRGGTLSLPQVTADKLSAQRFIDRGLKK